jgi:hypothetical protein
VSNPTLRQLGLEFLLIPDRDFRERGTLVWHRGRPCAKSDAISMGALCGDLLDKQARIFQNLSL